MNNQNTKSGKIMFGTAQTFGRAFGIILPLCVFSALVSAFLIYAANDTYAFIKPDMAVTVEFEGNNNLEEVSEMLAASGVIENPHLFQLYAKHKNAEDSIVRFSGEVSLNSAMSYREIILAFL